MRPHPMTLTSDDYLKLRSLVSSELTRAFSDPKMLRSLHQEIGRASLVPPGELTDMIVRMNSTVTLRDLRSKDLETFTLVYPAHADIANRRLSVLSPAGVGMLGCYCGDSVGWLTHSGWRMMKIEKVVSPPRRKSGQREGIQPTADDPDPPTQLLVGDNEPAKIALSVAGFSVQKIRDTGQRPGNLGSADQSKRNG